MQWLLEYTSAKNIESRNVYVRLAHYLHETSLDVIRNNHTNLNAASEHKLYYELQEQQQYSKALATHGRLVSIIDSFYSVPTRRSLCKPSPGMPGAALTLSICFHTTKYELFSKNMLKLSHGYKHKQKQLIRSAAASTGQRYRDKN